MKIEGMDKLIANFKSLPDDMSKKMSLRMVASAGGVVKKEAKRIAQSLGLRKTGALIKNIAIKRDKSPNGTTTYNLGVRHGRAMGNGKKVIKYLAVGKSGRVITKRQNDPYYWRFLQFKTKFRAATPFLDVALANKKDEAINAMSKPLEKYLSTLK